MVDEQDNTDKYHRQTDYDRSIEAYAYDAGENTGTRYQPVDYRKEAQTVI
jgi:hypothetical protein